MKLIVGCDGREAQSYFDTLRHVAQLAGTEVIFVHVTDQSVQSDWERSATRRLLGRPPASLERFNEARARSANQILEDALTATTSWPAADRRAVVLAGNPERELVRLALAEKADLMAVGQHRLELGPHALGHCARFVVDHAPCTVIVVRGADITEAAARLLDSKLKPRYPPDKK
ncbi:MAG: hypothetical protein JWO42_1589 [Chloroflexi bacterium]|nr:hypothetical protein [Chloroflexota bacterium]